MLVLRFSQVRTVIRSKDIMLLTANEKFHEGYKFFFHGKNLFLCTYEVSLCLLIFFKKIIDKKNSFESTRNFDRRRPMPHVQSFGIFGNVQNRIVRRTQFFTIFAKKNPEFNLLCEFLQASK